MNPSTSHLSSKGHDPEGFGVRTSQTRKERLHRSVRVRNAKSGWAS